MTTSTEPLDRLAATVDDLIVAFNTHDPDAFTAFFTEDGWFVDVVANQFTGHNQILAAHQHAFTGPTAHAHSTITGHRARLLAPGIGYIEATWHITHDTSNPDTTPHPARRGLLAFTAVQQPDQSWKLTTGTNTDYTHAFTRTTNGAPE